jgi:branched-chain amino acid transport system ATP-binding protein
MLSLNNIEVIFENVFLVIKGLSLEVPEGGIITLLGANGAGKSTTLKAISGLLRVENGEVTKGAIELDGQTIEKKTPAEIVKSGIAMVPEGRRVFEHLSTEENLIVGAHIRKNKAEIRRDVERVYEYFPRLQERSRVRAGYLSGGEQQMLAIGRGMMSRPRLMLLDEPSLGLAPQLVAEIFEIVVRLNKEENVSFLLVEQNAVMALSIAQYGYILETGRVVMSGSADTLRDNEDIKEFYLGITERGHKSFREVKHYRRRKRWMM